jgi:adenylosuccinate lyase
MTSSDVLDTCLSVQLTQAADLLLGDLDAVLAALKTPRVRAQDTLTIGRSHGIHAEPTTFGLKLAGHYAEFARDRARLLAAREEVAVARSRARSAPSRISIRGWRNTSPAAGLRPEPVSTQIIRATAMRRSSATLGVIASGIERLATEVRHLQRSEVREAEEFFHPGQKGSSVMPHKRNPVLSENLTGLARIVRAAVVPALENVTLWHERDISHSSVERAIAPDATIALDFALMRLAGMMERLVVLSGTDAGQPGEPGRRGLFRRSIVGAGGHDFRTNLEADPDVVGRVSSVELDAAFDPALHMRSVDRIFARVFGECRN